MKSIHEWLKERVNEDLDTGMLARSLGGSPGSSMGINSQEVRLASQMDSKLRSIINDMRQEASEKEILESIIRAAMSMLQKKHTIKASDISGEKVSDQDDADLVSAFTPLPSSGE